MSLNKLIRNCIPASFLATDVATTQAALADLKTRCLEWLHAQAEEHKEKEKEDSGAGAAAEADPDDPRAKNDNKKTRKPPVTLHSSGFEIAPAQLERIYTRMKYNINDAFTEWVSWVQWRRDLGINDFKDVSADVKTSAMRRRVYM